ncbi:MAG: hypothetical protein HQ596_07420 [Candidatus Saganbacteria bacterium]|nr:hypothetical protein [Candidatus Saganbacteria bacterium]
MSKIIDYLEKVDAINKHFVGTISFKMKNLNCRTGEKWHWALMMDTGF